MAKAKKLPSGSWRCLVYDYTDPTGKRIYKSFTCEDPSPAGKRKAEFEAAAYAADKSSAGRRENNITFGNAIDRYIASRESILSPGTIREYKRSRKIDYASIENLFIGDITQEIIQLLINQKAESHSPKTVRNIHGLLYSVMKEFRPDFAINTRLPQKKRPNLYIPTDGDIKKLINAAEIEDDMLIAILLAAFGPLRRSEICGLESGDIVNKVAHIQRAIVLNDNREWITKVPKSAAGDRYIPLPDFVFAKIEDKKGKIVDLHPNNITDRFSGILERAGLPHFRFHDLRHYCASIQHALGISDAYIMQRGGWNSDAVLKQVYRHALQDKSVQMNDIANNHFNELCNTKCNTK